MPPETPGFRRGKGGKGERGIVGVTTEGQVRHTSAATDEVNRTNLGIAQIRIYGVSPPAPSHKIADEDRRPCRKVAPRHRKAPADLKRTGADAAADAGQKLEEFASV